MRMKQHQKYNLYVDIYTTKKKYNIIYANPTWEGKQSADELCKLPVQRITDKDCALLLWIKSNKMIETIKIINTTDNM